MKRKVPILLITLLMVGCKAYWPLYYDFKPNTIGGELQETFKSHAKACEVVNVKNQKKEDSLNYIPTIITDITAFELDKPVESVDISGAGLMFAIFPAENINKATSIVEDLDKLSPSKIFRTKELESINSFLLKPDPLFSNFAVRTNCSGCIESAINAKINLPYAKIKSGLESDRKSESSVILFQGWFSSPLVSYFENKGSDGVEAHLNLWEYYGKTENSNLINNAFMISEFEGVMGSHVREQSKNLELNNMISAEASFKPVEVSGELKSSFNKSDFFQVNQFKTLIYYDDKGDGRQLNFYKLPSIKTISEVFSRVEYKFISSKERITKGDFVHFVDLIGVPKKLCNGLWSATVLKKGIYKNDKVNVVSTYQKANERKYNNKSYCSCKVSGTIDDKNFTDSDSDPKRLTINYDLINALQLTNKKGEQEKLSLIINKEFPTSTEPQVRNISSPISWNSETDNDFISLNWEKTITFFDDNRLVDYTAGKKANILEIKRVNGLTDLTYEVVELRNNNGKKEYQLLIETNFFPKSDLKLTEPDKEVELNLTFEIETADGAFEELTMSIPLREPSKINSNDLDNDNIENSMDNCPNISNPSQDDADDDKIGDKCDNCPNVKNKNQNDKDNDGVGDLCDNCPDKNNPLQKDENKNGTGDECED